MNNNYTIKPVNKLFKRYLDKHNEANVKDFERWIADKHSTIWNRHLELKELLRDCKLSQVNHLYLKECLEKTANR